MFMLNGIIAPHWRLVKKILTKKWQNLHVEISYESKKTPLHPGRYLPGAGQPVLSLGLRHPALPTFFLDFFSQLEKSGPGSSFTFLLVYANITIVMNNTRENLLRAGLEEFYHFGYKQASLRRICKACGVTTGAFYFSFASKHDLFCSIVDPVIGQFFAMADQLAGRELADPSSSRENDRKTMEFELLHRKELIILLEKSEGSGRENLRERILERLIHYFTLFSARELGRQPNPDVMRFLAELRLQANLNLIRGEYTVEQMLFFNDILGIYAESGWENLMHNFKDRL